MDLFDSDNGMGGTKDNVSQQICFLFPICALYNTI